MSNKISSVTPQNVDNFVLPPPGTMFSVYPVSFDASTSQLIMDMNYAMQQGQFSVIQSIIIDTTNLSTGNSLTIYFGNQAPQFSITQPAGVKQSYTVPAYTYPYFNIVSTSGSTGICEFWFLNFPVLPQSYSQATVSSGTQNVNVTNTSLPVTVGNTTPISVSLSGTSSMAVSNVTSRTLGIDYQASIDTGFSTTLTTTGNYNGPSCYFTDINVRVLQGTSAAANINLTVTVGSWTLTIPLVLSATATTSETFIKIYNGGARSTIYGSIVASISAATTGGGINIYGSGISTRNPID